jgi:hypothetical protein
MEMAPSSQITNGEKCKKTKASKQAEREEQF